MPCCQHLSPITNESLSFWDSITNWKGDWTWLQAPSVILSPPFTSTRLCNCVTWNSFSRKPWETSPHPPRESWGSRALLRWGHSGFTASAVGGSSHLQTGWDQTMVPRSCALGTTASLQPLQTHAALGRDFGPSSLCISDKLQRAGLWGICSPYCLSLRQDTGPGTDEGSCLSQGKRGHRLKAPSWACTGIHP